MATGDEPLGSTDFIAAPALISTNLPEFFFLKAGITIRLKPPLTPLPPNSQRQVHRALSLPQDSDCREGQPPRTTPHPRHHTARKHTHTHTLTHTHTHTHTHTLTHAHTLTRTPTLTPTLTHTHTLSFSLKLFLWIDYSCLEWDAKTILQAQRAAMPLYLMCCDEVAFLSSPTILKQR